MKRLVRKFSPFVTVLAVIATVLPFGSLTAVDHAVAAGAQSPPVRVAPGMAYDPAGGVVVLFGGYQGCYHCNLHDTWTWDGVNWKKQRPATSPPKRDSMGMAYDALRGQVVMFGGIYWPTPK